MAFCSNCGSKLEDSDLFCVVCGAQQKPTNGPVYNPAGAGPQQFQGTQAPNVNAEAFKRYMNEIFGILKGMILSPISTVQALSKNAYKEASIILAVVLGLVQGLLFMWAIKQTIGSIFDSIGAAAGAAMGAFGGALGSSMGNLFSIPYGKFFLLYLLVYIIAMGSLFFGLYLAGRYIMKGKASLLSVWNVTVAAAIPFTASVIVGLILTYISGILGEIVILFGILISTFSVYSGTKEGAEISDNNTAFAVGLASVVSSFIVLLICGAMLKSQMAGLMSGNFLNLLR